MTLFSLLTPEARSLLAGLCYLAVTGQLILCLCQHLCRIGPWRRVLDGLLLALQIAALARVISQLRTAPPAIPWLLFPAAAAAVLAWSAAGIVQAWRYSRELLSPVSVRQALDDLNGGICFTDAAGRVTLVNRTMGRLAGALLGSYPQTLEELTAALGAPGESRGVERLDGSPTLYRFPDGTVWRFRTQELTEPEFSGWRQTTAQDVTELYRANERLARENEALRRTNEETRRMYERLADRIRQQETLALKMRIHDDIGASLIAISALMRGGRADDAEGQLKLLRRAVSYFGSGAPARPGTFADARRKAEGLNVTLALDGALPASPALEELAAAAARECVTNCVSHAGGSRVDVKIVPRAGGYTVTLTNDGRAPSGPIVEGGGLSALRRCVEAAGCEMRTEHAPRFALILELKEQEP